MRVDIYEADFLSGGYTHYVTGDLRTPGSGFSESNGEIGERICKLARERGLHVQHDSETCQFFANTRDRETAEALAALIEEEMA